MSEPRHGEERNRRVESGWTHVEGHTPDGQPVALGHGQTETVSERFCAVCKKWVPIRGVLQAIGFEFEHAENHKRGPA